MDDKTLIRILKSSPFFYELSPEEFEEVVKQIKMHHLKSDETVIIEREKGDSLFFVVDGVLRVTIKNPDNGKNILLSKLGVGNFFGEFSFLTRRLRSASVFTITDSQLIEIPRGIYEKFAIKYPSARRFLVDLCFQHQGSTAALLQSLKVDRRRFPRFKIKGKIKFQEYGNTGENKVIKLGIGALVDISEGGVCFRVARNQFNQNGPGVLGKEYKARIEAEVFPVPVKVLEKVVSLEVGLAKRELVDWYVVRMAFIKIARNDKKTFRDFLSSCKNL